MNPPFSSKQVLQGPAIFALLGIFVYVFALISLKNRGVLPVWRFLAHVLVLVAAYLGFKYFNALVLDENKALYANAITGSVLRLSHYVGFFGCLGLFLALLLVDAAARKKAKRLAEEDDF